MIGRKIVPPKENLNNKDLFIKKLIYRSKYTGTKETDILLSNFVDAYIYDLTFEQLKTSKSNSKRLKQNSQIVKVQLSKKRLIMKISLT